MISYTNEKELIGSVFIWEIIGYNIFCYFIYLEMDPTGCWTDHNTRYPT